MIITSFIIYLCCCFRTFGNSDDERRESTNVGQTMKSFTLYRYIFLRSKPLFFLSCCLYWVSFHCGWQFTQTQKVMIHKEYRSIIPWYIKIRHSSKYGSILWNWKQFFFKIVVELPKPSQSHYLALNDRARSQVIVDSSPLNNEQISEYASLNPHTRSCEIPREHVTIKQIVGKGAFSLVAKATADNLQGRTKKTLVAVKMLSGTK